MAIDLSRVRYLYRRRSTGRYGSMTAVSMADAKRGTGDRLEFVKAKFEPEIALFVDHGDQTVRRLAFEGARTMTDFLEQYPDCKVNNSNWMLGE